MKKLIALLVTACMLITLVPAAAFAIGTGGDQGTEPAVSQDLTMTPEETAEPVDEEGLEQGAQPEEEMPQINEIDITMEPAEGDGWQQDGAGHWMYYQGGVYLIGFYKFGTSTYYFDTNGFMLVDWQTINGKQYYFDTTPGTPGAPGSTYGVMKTGWMDYNGNRYYFDLNTGAMKTGWLALNGAKYYFKPDSGIMKTGWLKLNGNKYWFQDNGQMVTGSKSINGYKYYFDTSSGKMQTGWVSHDGYKFYYNTNNGRMKTGWLKLSGKKYYLNEKNGRMVTGMKKINGYKYYFSDSGIMQTGAKKYNGALYYFFSSGKAVSNKGWFKGSDGKTRYSLGGGKVATGKMQIGSNWYEFSKKTGVCLRNLGDSYDRAINNMSSRTGYFVQVIKSKYQTRVYKGSKGNWSKIYTFTCAIGKPGYDTATGTFTVNGKKKINNYKDNGNQVHWDNGVNFGSNGGFNSPVYTGWDTTQGSVYDGRLGGKYTRGRVRLSYNNSLWMYNNIGNGTTVYVR